MKNVGKEKERCKPFFMFSVGRLCFKNNLIVESTTKTSRCAQSDSYMNESGQILTDRESTNLPFENAV